MFSNNTPPDKVNIRSRLEAGSIFLDQFRSVRGSDRGRLRNAPRNFLYKPRDQQWNIALEQRRFV
jgi:hypothetical protein